VQTEGTRPFERYRANFTNIRLLGSYIEDLAAEHGVPIVSSHQLDRTVAEVLELIVDTVIRDDGTTADEPTDRED
jgi:2-phosphoglycerate kinase